MVRSFFLWVALALSLNHSVEMEDDVVSDGGYDDLSPEDHRKLTSFLYTPLNLTCLSERMMNGLEHIRNMIGDAEASKLSDEDIAEALYHFYFDVEQATAWLLGASSNFASMGIYPNLHTEEQERRLAAQARKGELL